MMKFMKWKIWGLTSFICLLPILLGLAVWDKLPDVMAIHFDMYNNPDNFAPKWFVVFGLPVLMVLPQTICCVINDVNTKKFGERKKFTRVTKWIIPVLSMVLQVATLAYGLSVPVDIRCVVMLLVGVMFIVLGNYMPKFDRVKNFNMDAEKARKVNRLIGRMMVGMGILAILTVFLEPMVSVLWLFLLIPLIIISVIYGVKVAKE
ncbi:MAG: DUF1648 domain-containing protein [Clostridia bacterium]|nr:DUF1648 domain-containing protein [Clostridia bacterium]MBQ3554155.1 DUF1648 domain-containing protein [Clostridia bacterium]